MKTSFDMAAVKRNARVTDRFQSTGVLRSARGVLSSTLPAGVGELCLIHGDDERAIHAEVIGFDEGESKILPFEFAQGIRPNATVIGTGRTMRVPLGHELLGRVIDALGRPIDDRGELRAGRTASVMRDAPRAMSRTSIEKPFVTGVKAIDGLLTLGQGQRVGLFAGSGVGKSTLLGEIARGAESDLNVVALIGERGREVRPFLEKSLGVEGLRRSVVVVATADETPLMRVRAAQTAATIADDFRRQGANVLLMMDSLTRMAMAQREIGLLLGEPPSARGYTPSVFQLLANTLESLGNSDIGAITCIATVLVDGDDMDEPIADATRSIMDGHIVLNRKLAEKAHFPAIDVGASISRVLTDVTSAEHQADAIKLREILSTYKEVEDLIRIGMYEPGTDPAVDRAVQLMPAVLAFLKQQPGDSQEYPTTQTYLRQLTATWQR